MFSGTYITGSGHLTRCSKWNRKFWCFWMSGHLLEVVAFGGTIAIYRNLVLPDRKQGWLLNTVYVNSFNRPLREHISTRNAHLQETSAFVDVYWLALLQAWKWNAQLSSGGTTYTLSRSTTDMRSGIRIFLLIFHLASGRLPVCVLTQKVELYKRITLDWTYSSSDQWHINACKVHCITFCFCSGIQLSKS